MFSPGPGVPGRKAVPGAGGRLHQAPRESEVASEDGIGTEEHRRAVDREGEALSLRGQTPPEGARHLDLEDPPWIDGFGQEDLTLEGPELRDRNDLPFERVGGIPGGVLLAGGRAPACGLRRKPGPEKGQKRDSGSHSG